MIKNRIKGYLARIQKAYDVTNFVRHRASMLLRFYWNRMRKRMRLGEHIESILIVRLASIGDVVRASAVARALRERYSLARIDFLTTETALPVIQRNPWLNAVYTVTDLALLREYDWIVNLQNLNPPESFVRESGWKYSEILDYLSKQVRCKLFSGRRIENGRETTSTNVMYCLTEMEELFLTTLLPYDLRRYPTTEIHVDGRARVNALEKFPISGSVPVVAIFLGSNSVGCGYDEGFRTYSIEFIEQLVQRFYERFTLVVIGQSGVRNLSEREKYRGMLDRYPRMIDLVDKTNLEELVCLMDRFDVVISCDSSPIHIAMARGVPLVGLYANNATFALAPRLEGERYIAINGYPPCFRYSWRWKYFCQTCRDEATRAYYCKNKTFVFGPDLIPIATIERSVERLLASR